MSASRPAQAPVATIRRRFLRFSSLLTAIIVALLAALLALQVNTQRQVRELERTVLPSWRAALQLSADARTVNVQAARLPLTLSEGELRTVRGLVDAAKALLLDSFETSTPGLSPTDEQALRRTLEEIGTAVDLATDLAARRIGLAAQEGSAPGVDEQVLSLERRVLLRQERDLSRRIDDLHLTLASHIAIVAADNERQLDEQRTRITRLRELQTVLLVVAGALMAAVMFAQFRLVDRHLLRRLENLRRSMAEGMVAPQLISRGPPRDELDAMLVELAALLERLADQAQELQKLATSDPLTTQANRRSLFERLAHEVERARRYRRPLSALMIDIDHFKPINDTWGHAAGDRVLRSVADVLAATVRQSDLLARYGGEEFVVLLPETDAGDASRLAELMRSRVAETVQQVGGGHTAQVTVSIGCATLRGDESADAFIERADEAVYRAKGRGRNCVECAP